MKSVKTKKNVKTKKADPVAEGIDGLRADMVNIMCRLCSLEAEQSLRKAKSVDAGVCTERATVKLSDIGSSQTEAIVLDGRIHIPVVSGHTAAVCCARCSINYRYGRSQHCNEARRDGLCQYGYLAEVVE
jgi:hypothetical protein